MELGRHLRQLRLDLSLGEEQVATRSGLQIEVIRALELGQHAADVDTLRSFAQALDMGLGELFTLWERQVLARRWGV
ncbi:helix-turn-helix domain-containing protein [Enhygromyxa salina]|uniref:helix-turn-helix domain-containing protein n=1 Tax=Enhygromyxa salina TaxID=215803 RepID=UPI0015E5B131|nr:helix-turn-helix domain-containing protein [Enhygromyxa salina]